MATSQATGDYPYNSMYVAGPGMVISSSNTWTSTLELDLPGNKDFRELESRIAKIEERLAILRPNEELQKRFPALQEAYEHYKLIEKLVNDGVTKNE